jgi:hypothetical protein
MKPKSLSKSEALRIIIETAEYRGMLGQTTGRKDVSASAVTFLINNFILAINTRASVLSLRVYNNSWGLAQQELRFGLVKCTDFSIEK